MTDREIFQDAFETALAESKKTGKRYLVLFPSIANKHHGSPQDIFLIVPVVSEVCLDEVEKEDVAFTIYPTGQICWGYTILHRTE
jgi:hypothetical protein